MKPELWERKYEIDSLCYPVQLSYLLWKNTGCTEQFTGEWLEAAKAVIRVFRTEQDHENASPYTFERENCSFTDTLSRDGKGALVKSNVGLIWSGFRPSDDACVYGYLIPSDWNYEKMNQTKSKYRISGAIAHGWKLIVRHWSITCVCSNGCCQIRVSLCRQ